MMFSFYGLRKKKILTIFLDRLNNYDPNITFTNEYRKKEIPFLDLKLGIKNGNITTDSYVKETDSHQNIIRQLILIIIKSLLFLVKLFALVAWVHLKKTLRDT